MTSFVQVLGLLILLAGGDPPTPIPPLPPVWPPTDPMTHTAVLPNADFEAGLVGWQTWSEDTGKPADASTLDYAIAPFFSVERNPLLVHSGAASLHVGRMYDPWHAGLKRVVSAPPGAHVRFCIDGRLYASNRDFGREASWASLDGHMQVGLYPDGEADWNTSGIVWSVVANPHDEWRSMCVETVAGPSGRITLLTSTNYRGVAAKHLDAWWDDAELTIAGSDPSAASNVLLPGITITQSINVLLLVPAQSTSISASTFIVWPAQMYVSAQGLTLSMSSTRSNLLPSAVILPTVIAPAESRTAGQAATISTLKPASTPIPSPSFTGTAKPLPTATTTIAPQPATPIAIALPTRAIPASATLTPLVLEPASSLNSTAVSGLAGLAVLLFGGIGAALVLVRRR